MKLTHNCPKCKKPAKIQAQFPMGSMTNYVYMCGHCEVRVKLDIANEISGELNEVLLANSTTSSSTISSSPEPTHKELYEDLDNWVTEGGRTKGINEQEVPKYIPPSFYAQDRRKRAYDFQIEGIKFAESTQLNCLIADAMGLGKTIQALIALACNKAVTFPVLAVVKGATVFQWQHEYNEWISREFISCMPILNRTSIIPGFNFYIISMDMLSKPDIIDKLLALKIKAIIIDEVQNFKDGSAKRSLGLIKLIQMGDIKYKIALSGTPIKNKVGEYFTILNILAPLHFSSYDWFKKYWLLPETKINKNGGGATTVYKRLNPAKAQEFKDLTSSWIIRREKHDVLTNLPALSRDYQIIEIDDQNIKNSYNHAVDLFKNFLNDNKTGIKSTQLLGWLAQLRSITGQAKCKQALDWIEDFLESTDESLAIGIQHHSVRDTLYSVLDYKKLKPLKLSGEDNVYRKNDIVRAFTEGHNRVLVINSLAGGIGLNLQTCANALVLERQWNSADEEQFEARFHRNGQQKAVTVTYMIAKGTIDEFFHEMVLTKKKILVEAGIGDSVDIENNMASLLEFSEIVANHKI